MSPAVTYTIKPFWDNCWQCWKKDQQAAYSHCLDARQNLAISLAGGRVPGERCLTVQCLCLKDDPAAWREEEGSPFVEGVKRYFEIPHQNSHAILWMPLFKWKGLWNGLILCSQEVSPVSQRAI